MFEAALHILTLEDPTHLWSFDATCPSMGSWNASYTIIRANPHHPPSLLPPLKQYVEEATRVLDAAIADVEGVTTRAAARDRDLADMRESASEQAKRITKDEGTESSLGRFDDAALADCLQQREAIDGAAAVATAKLVMLSEAVERLACTIRVLHDKQAVAVDARVADETNAS